MLGLAVAWYLNQMDVQNSLDRMMPQKPHGQTPK